MIQDKELRLGNYVKDSNGTISTINELSVMDAELRNSIDFDVCDYEDLQPIELTEDILLKCGFYYKGFNFYFYDLSDGYHLSYKLCLDYGELEVCRNMQSTCKIDNLNYLHQLQNLYFALTNEELTINL